MTKYLLGGVSLTGLTSSCMFYGGMNGIPSQGKGKISNSTVEGEKQETLIEKAGLECKDGKYCEPSWSGKRMFNVEKDKKDENLIFGKGAKGKIRVHTDSEGYPEGFRFTIEGGDIPLSPRKSWIKNSILRLEEFENYEIKSKEGKYYFSRTKNSKEGKILELGLPETCVLPETGESTCSVFHVGKVKFGEGFEGAVDAETSLTISKTSDKSFRDGYKFTFTFHQDVTIGDRVFKANSPADFRTKKHEGRLILERAWVDEKDLLDKVNLECEENGDCTIKSGALKIKKAEGQDFIEISDISQGKIKLYKDDENYFNGLRLQVEGGKITSGNDVLEEFETYEIKEKGDEYYLLRKKSSEERIRELLKYPCSLSTSTCSISNERKLKAINFEGKDDETISLKGGQTVNVAVSKATEDDFPVGWKFTITSTGGDLNISNSNSVKANTPTDFKLKRHDDGSLTLERAWANENELAGKVGLSCEEDGYCSLKTSGTLNIKKVEEKLEISTLEGEGKIKLSKDTKGYSNGLKFEIEKGKIGSGDEALEEFETYEIKNVEGKYYLVLKTKSEERMKELLNFPSRCFVTSECDELNEKEFKDINFEGKDAISISLGSQKVKITVSTAPEDDYPLGRKFTVTSPQKITISSTSVKANSPTDFKLKRHENGSLSLEKAWDNEKKLIGKVGLECDASDNCTIKNGPIKVRKGGGKSLEISSLDEGGGKIKLYKESDNYSNSLKFAVEDGKIGTGNDVLEEFETYEIKENGSEYYLNLKTSADVEIKKLLKFPGRCYSLSSCDNLSLDDLKKINFKDKEENSMSLQSGTVKITVSKTAEEDFPLDRKFTLESPSNLSISSSISVKAKTPTEFKIKRDNSAQSADISLEKAWTLETLTKKVGLSCTDEIICTITSGSLNVKKGNELFTKASESNPQTPPAGKIKLIKDQEGYNEGFKFLIQDADIKLSADGNKDGVLEEFETYEIKKHGDNYYLEIKTKAKEEKWKALGLPAKCQSYKVNHGCQLNDAELGKIKFYGKKANGTITIPSGARVFLKTFEETNKSNFPLGIKVKMEVKDHNVKIPKTSNGSIVLWKNFETEFRVKKENSDTYSLEGTFDMNALVRKAGITKGDCDDELGCTVGAKINVRKDGTNYWRNANVAETTKRITYQRGAKEINKFNNNIVFTVQEKGIKLSGKDSSHETWSVGTLNSIEAGTYEIRGFGMGAGDGESEVFYLSKKEFTTFDVEPTGGR